MLSICIQAPESTTNSLASGSFVDAASNTQSFAVESDCSFVVLFQFVNVFGKVPSLSSVASLLNLSVSSWDLVLRTSWRRDFADEEL